MISDHTLNEIRARINLVDLVGEYVALKRSGHSHTGLCPFHNEKTPSFHVHALKQVFKCFGCQKGGNLFTFFTAIEGVSFPEAVETLAGRAGVILEKDIRTKKKEEHVPAPGEERLLSANAWAAKYFHYLLVEGKDQSEARDYVKSRKIGIETCNAFQVGVAPRGWNTLRDLMLKRGFTLNELVSVGLVVPKESSGGYDRFRERLMFPIHSPKGKVIGFGARLIKDEANQPKYLNSSESPLFSKRQTLYGLFHNGRGIRLNDEAVLVEGYMDVLGLSNAGIQNAVATLGTSFTEEHALILKNYTRHVTTVFDPDKAGLEAWHRSVHLFLEAGLFAKDLSLPNELDPDEFVQAEGAEKFKTLCAKAPRQITKLLKEIASRGSLTETETAKTLEALTPILVASRRLPERAVLLDDVSLVLKVSRQSLQDLADGGRRELKTSRPLVVTKPKEKTAVPLPLDRELVQAAVHWPEMFKSIPLEEWKAAAHNGQISALLTQLSQDGVSHEMELEKISQSQVDPWILEEVAAALMAKSPTKEPEWFKGVRDRVRVLWKTREASRIRTQVKLSQRLGNEEEQLKLLSKLRELRVDA